MIESEGLEKLRTAGWEIHSINFANVIIQEEFADELTELASVLLHSAFTIEDSIIKRGGGLADQTQELTAMLNEKGW